MMKVALLLLIGITAVKLALVDQLITHYLVKNNCQGKSKIGDEVTVHYVGTFPDTKKFDSSRDGNKPFSFRIGIDGVIEGWKLGLQDKCVGDHFIIIIPPSLGYGSKDRGPIPANSVLHFDIELLKINGRG